MKGRRKRLKKKKRERERERREMKWRPAAELKDTACDCVISNVHR